MAVGDLDRAANFYSRLFDRPSQEPMGGLTQWDLPGAGIVQLVAEPERAGGSMLTIDTDDIRAAITALEARGIEVGDLDETSSDKVLFAALEDPDGNFVTLVQRR